MCVTVEKPREVGREQRRCEASSSVQWVGVGEGRFTTAQLVLTRGWRDHLSAYQRTYCHPGLFNLQFSLL